MADGNLLTTALGGFCLGLGTALSVALFTGRQAFEFLATFNVWALRGVAGILAVLSIALILISNGGGVAAVAPVAPAPPSTMSGRTAIEAASMEAATMALATKLPSASMPDLMPQAAAPDNSFAVLFAKAAQHRRKREFQQACDVYREVIAASGMTAEAWADYADALASSSPNGSLAGEPAKAIERALAMDPKHTKALWLKASLAHEEHRFQDAVATWRQLLALVAPGSSDARIIQANLIEAERLAGMRG